MAAKSRRKAKVKEVGKINLSILRSRFEKANEIIGRFEQEVEKTIKSLRKQGRKSGDAIRKVLDEVTVALGAQNLRDAATEKTDEILKEVRKRTEDVVKTVRQFELQFDKDFFTSVKGNINELFEKVQSLEWVEYTKDKVVDTKNQVFQMLRIPSQAEVDNLTRKVVSLEKKLSIISKHQKEKEAA